MKIHETPPQNFLKKVPNFPLLWHQRHTRKKEGLFFNQTKIGTFQTRDKKKQNQFYVIVKGKLLMLWFA